MKTKFFVTLTETMILFAVFGSIIAVGAYYFSLPVVHLNPDGKCVRVMVVKDGRGAKQSCGSIDLKKATYLTEYVAK